jgi:hypothetical protein
MTSYLSSQSQINARLNLYSAALAVLLCAHHLVHSAYKTTTSPRPPNSPPHTPTSNFVSHTNLHPLVKIHSPPSMSSSPFLRLPSEVRNAIYEFVLTSPTGLDLRTYKRFNQLKHVNCQMRFETSNLEFAYNSSFTFRTASESPMDEFLQVATLSCSESDLALMPEMNTIDSPDKIHEESLIEAMFELARFSRVHPHLHIKYYFMKRVIGSYNSDHVAHSILFEDYVTRRVRGNVVGLPRLNDNILEYLRRDWASMSKAWRQAPERMTEKEVEENLSAPNLCFFIQGLENLFEQKDGTVTVELGSEYEKFEPDLIVRHAYFRQGKYWAEHVV